MRAVASDSKASERFSCSAAWWFMRASVSEDGGMGFFGANGETCAPPARPVVLAVSVAAEERCPAFRERSVLSRALAACIVVCCEGSGPDGSWTLTSSPAFVLLTAGPNRPRISSMSESSVPSSSSDLSVPDWSASSSSDNRSCSFLINARCCCSSFEPPPPLRLLDVGSSSCSTLSRRLRACLTFYRTSQTGRPRGALALTTYKASFRPLHTRVSEAPVGF